MALSDHTSYPITVDPNNPYKPTRIQRLLIRTSWRVRDASYWIKDRGLPWFWLFRFGCWIHR